MNNRKIIFSDLVSRFSIVSLIRFLFCSMFRSGFLPCIIYFIALFTGNSFGQKAFIFSKEGHPFIERRVFIKNCLITLNKPSTDKTALSICNCKAEKLDYHFTTSEYSTYSQTGMIALSGMIKKDSLFQIEYNKCITNSGKSILLEAEGFEIDFVASCIRKIRGSTERKLDIKRVLNFCNCQMELIKTKKLSDSEVEKMSEPNSVLFFETMDKCGDPYYENETSDRNWNQNKISDITGPATDTISYNSLNGMTYIKIETGGIVQFWLFDTGASDLVINQEMEIKLKNDCFLSDSSYMGKKGYEMANGDKDTLRLYKMDNIKIGEFTVNNVLIAVSNTGNKNIVGRGLLNKFSFWSMNNKNNTLILNK